ncbi:hypothetical protein H6790_01495 [Candidatus Nomurabacteria bacterium]|nr:hypothetical protein [Candidatus Nomurabacteria bacterium]
MSKKIKQILNLISYNKEDENLYEIALEEIEQDKKIKGIWAKAVSMSDGYDKKTESKYIELRVNSLKNEIKNRERAKPTNDEIKDLSYNILVESVSKLLGRIRWTSFFVGIGGLLSSFVGFIFLQEFGIDESALILLGIGVILITLSIFLYVNFKKIFNKSDDFDFVKNKITVVSVVAILVSVVMTISGVFMPVIGLCGLLILFNIVINLSKFHINYNKYKKLR